MPPKRVLPHPIRPLLFFRFECFLVAYFSSPDPLVLNAGKKVETDLAFGVSGDAALQDVDDFVGEFGDGTVAVRYGRRLEAIELVEFAI
jgi:hypothetical protein